jgi:hypothetical protein
MTISFTEPPAPPPPAPERAAAALRAAPDEGARWSLTPLGLALLEAHER